MYSTLISCKIEYGDLLPHNWITFVKFYREDRFHIKLLHAMQSLTNPLHSRFQKPHNAYRNIHFNLVSAIKCPFTTNLKNLIDNRTEMQYRSLKKRWSIGENGCIVNINPLTAVCSFSGVPLHQALEKPMTSSTLLLLYNAGLTRRIGMVGFS